MILMTGHAEDLKSNLQQAEIGDYIVIAQGKTLTLFHIFAKSGKKLTVEEVTIAEPIACKYVKSWKDWITSNAPHNTSWVLYQIDLDQGTLENYYSFTKQGYFIVPQAENFLQTLLHLKLEPIPDANRRKAGMKPKASPVDNRPLWQPKMVVEGRVIDDVAFNAYETEWPKDGSPISGKAIEIYIPKEHGTYPAYFPYWLQVKGVFGPARVRIIDSGKNMISPKQ